MAATSAYVKIQIGADLRRILLTQTQTLDAFKAYVWSLHSSTPDGATVENMTIKYRDAEGDLVTLGSTEELQLFAHEVFTKKEVQQRLFVSFDVNAPSKAAAPAAASTEAPRQPTPPPPPPRLRPEQIIANALSDAEAVRSLQNAAASPVINDAVLQVAQGFANGGPVGAWVAVAQAVPTAKAVFEEAMDNNATLSDARKKLLEQHGIDVNDFGSCMNWGRAFGCHRRGGFGGWGGPHHRHPHHERATQAFHPWVVCDGCDNHADLKAQSLAAGHLNVRGWIVGPRHRSLKVDDFDLCQSCFGTGRFNASHGPFEVMTREARHGWGGGGCGRPTPPPHCAPPHAAPHCAPPHGAPHCAPPHHPPQPGSHFAPPHHPPHPGSHTGPHHHPHHPTSQEAPAWGGLPFFEWARHHHHQQPRGCRGSRRDVFSNIFRDVVAEGASAFEQAAKENDNEELASLARAFAESFRGSSGTASASAATSNNDAPAAEASTPQTAVQEESAPTAASPTPRPAPVDEPQQAKVESEDEEWEVPDVSPADSDDPFVKWRAALQQLASLGFTEAENYIEFLEEENGDLEAVVNRIVRRNA